MYGKQYEGAHREAASGVGFAAEGINKEKNCGNVGIKRQYGDNPSCEC